MQHTYSSFVNFAQNKQIQLQSCAPCKSGKRGYIDPTKKRQKRTLPQKDDVDDACGAFWVFHDSVANYSQLTLLLTNCCQCACRQTQNCTHNVQHSVLYIEETIILRTTRYNTTLRHTMSAIATDSDKSVIFRLAALVNYDG